MPYSEQTYAFDYLGSGNHGIYSGSEYYPYLNSNYDLRYKSIECEQNDKVIVDFGSYPERDSVVFKDKWGVKLKVSKGNILNFSGVTNADTNYIYAYRGDEKIGKLSVNTYKKKSYKVVLVSVNKAKLPDISKVIDCLHKVYKQAVDTIFFGVGEVATAANGWKTASLGKKIGVISNIIYNAANLVLINSDASDFIKKYCGENMLHLWTLFSKSLDVRSLKDATMVLDISNAFTEFNAAWAVFRGSYEVKKMTSEEEEIMKEIDSFISNIEKEVE